MFTIWLFIIFTPFIDCNANVFQCVFRCLFNIIYKLTFTRLTKIAYIWNFFFVFFWEVNHNSPIFTNSTSMCCIHISKMFFISTSRIYSSFKLHLCLSNSKQSSVAKSQVLHNIYCLLNGFCISSRSIVHSSMS